MSEIGSGYGDFEEFSGSGSGDFSGSGSGSESGFIQEVPLEEEPGELSSPIILKRYKIMFYNVKFQIIEARNHPFQESGRAFGW